VPSLPLPAPPLADETVGLRPWREDDVEHGLMLFADPVVQRFSWTEARPYTPADARAYFERQRAERHAGLGVELAVTEPGDAAAVLGCVSLFDVDAVNRSAATGYWLAARGRGRGAATHAVRLLTGWGFATLGLARIQLTCAPDNLASQRVAERCGFTREGLLRSQLAFKGGRRDTVVYGLLAGER
jgi:RimJ/RimL family protein N-acetyltransferase